MHSFVLAFSQCGNIIFRCPSSTIVVWLKCSRFRASMLHVARETLLKPPSWTLATPQRFSFSGVALLVICPGRGSFHCCCILESLVDCMSNLSSLVGIKYEVSNRTVNFTVLLP